VVNGEYRVMVGTTDQAFFPSGEPFFSSVGRALGAAAVSAGIAAELSDVALGAAPQMTAHGGGTAVAEALGSAPLFGRERVCMSKLVEILLKDLLQGKGHTDIVPQWLARVEASSGERVRGRGGLSP
jgi:hypothetical protein